MNTVQYTSCPICSSKEIKKQFNIKDHSISGETFEILKCGSCEFVFTNNVPVETEIGPYYKSEDYISHSDTQKGITSKLYHWARKQMLKKKRKLISNLGPGLNLLDVGAGTGYFPNEMKENGFNVSGIEVDDETRGYAKRKFDLTLYGSIDEVLETGNEKFNFITLWHVLEHLYNPKSFMDKFAQLLKNDGHLIVAVPNCNSYDAEKYQDKWAAYDVPIHLWHFTPTSMKKLCEGSGYFIQEMHYLPFDPFYISILSEKYNGGALGLVKGTLTGLKSYLKGRANVEKASSVVYVLRKSS